MELFSEENRRDPYALYAQLRTHSPVLQAPPPVNAWLVFDYDGVKRTLNDHETFSSAVPAPPNWFVFSDPPSHTRLRGLIAKAFTPAVVARMEPDILELSRSLLKEPLRRGEIDLAVDYAVPLPMKVISSMFGVPAADWHRFKHWSDVILTLSYTLSAGPEADAALSAFRQVTEEMSSYLARTIEDRRREPRNDLLTGLLHADVDGERLSHEQILGFFQMLIVGGQETTANLINNAVLAFLEHPEQLEPVRRDRDLLPRAVEEVLRYRSPVQWMMRTPKRDVEMHGQEIPAGALVLAVIGSANRDPKQFRNPETLDITRDPNPHIAFGHGIHFCLGAALSRLEARIALSDLLDSMQDIAFVDEQPWQPRRALHVHGPASLPIRFAAHAV